MAVTLDVLVSFDGTNGGSPTGDLIADANGNLFGTTESYGGTGHNGTVFEIANTPTGYASAPTTLVIFNGNDGSEPVFGLITDANGDLLGTTFVGGANSLGTAFEIVNTATGYANSPTTLVNFGGGFQYGNSGLLADANGDLFGIASGFGGVYEIKNTATGYASGQTSVASTSGGDPRGNLVADASGDLFGTTQGYGTSGSGTVYEIVNTATGYAASPTILVAFNGTDGGTPASGVIMDANGDLFGTTQYGGANNDGTVFEIPKTAGTYANVPTTLVSFDGMDGSSPLASLIMDANGDLFGTTSSGGADSDGTVFEIVKTSGGYATTPTTLVDFNGTNGSGPYGSLYADAGGNLFGTTNSGGTLNVGTVFELSGTGFQVACYLRGTNIATPTGERAIERLAARDLVLTGSGEVRPVVWIGRRHVDCGHHPKPEKVWPVRVRAGAFGDNIPTRDLWLSPDHAVYVKDVLIPIKLLINGISIEQVPMDEVTYYHVELECHDVLLADGLPAESYLDTGDRFNFDNGGWPVALHPDFGRLRWEGKGYAPLLVTGPALQAVRQWVNSLAAAALHGRRVACAPDAA